jgi:hypothetical protein
MVAVMKKLAHIGSVAKYLRQLGEHLSQYETAVHRLASSKLTRARDCRACFWLLHVGGSQLYLDYLLAVELNKAFPRLSRGESTDVAEEEPSEVYIARHFAMSKKLKAKLDSSNCWHQFDANNFFQEQNHLTKTADYVQVVVMHVPEIYSEVCRLDKYVHGIRRARLGRLPAPLVVGLEHTAHHISYSHYALEILSHEMSWR